ncbi:MAG: inorganic diphosphatase [Acetobacteraceae bacterium]|nr:inorganic diphosphatase [Acetobacteraceae bacterium]
MTAGYSGPIPLSRLPAFENRSGDVTVVVETPKGSPNKYGYDPAPNAFRLKAVLPEGTAFPYDFGFIPSTLGQDGDPIDLLLFLDSPAAVGCILTARLIGVIEARQREGDGEWVSNDRLLGVATHAHTHNHVHGLEDLRPNLLDEIEQFFAHYVGSQGREFDATGRAGPDRARALVEEAIARGRADAADQG